MRRANVFLIVASFFLFFGGFVVRGLAFAFTFDLLLFFSFSEFIFRVFLV